VNLLNKQLNEKYKKDEIFLRELEVTGHGRIGHNQRMKYDD